MKRQKRKAKQTNTSKTPKTTKLAGADSAPKNPSRRNFVKDLGGWGLTAAGVGAVGWYLVDHVSAGISEQDLSKIGNGVPAVVQIHDPQCSKCIALQSETRTALEDFDDGEIQFLVANIRSASGRTLANAHGVGHITLLLFDAKGRKRDVIVGNHSSETLKREFHRHLRVSGAS